MAIAFRAQATGILSPPPAQEDLRHWLFLMRHHDLPNCLLDWTARPLVALHFAAVLKENQKDTDGAIWMLNPWRWNQAAGITRGPVVIDAQDKNLDRLFDASFASFPKTKGAWKWKGDNPLEGKRVFAIYPTHISPRMTAQRSVFTIHEFGAPSVEDMYDGLLGSANGKPFLWKYHIPASAKPIIRKELYALGITPYALFPDLDHLAKEVLDRHP